MILFKNFKNIFFIQDLRKKILFTLGILIIYRLGNHIPVVGVNVEKLQQLMQQSKALGGLFNYLDLFSGGGLRTCTIFALGIMPYITASIMMQMLSMTIPTLEQLAKEGEYGRKIINQYTRYLALGISIFQGMSLAFMTERFDLVLYPGWAFRFLFVLSLTVGAMFVMWLGEQISLFGLGNGSSLIIFAGIVSRFPFDIVRIIEQVRQGLMDPFIALILLAAFIIITGCIVFLEKGERKIPVQYARRVVGQRVYGGQSTYIPFKINTAGVMPVIFAGAVLNIPLFLATAFSEKYAFFTWLAQHMGNPTSILWNTTEFVLIIFFSFFYTALVFNPEELAENIKKSGGFIPGIRPGRKTAEFFNYILTRIGLIGAIYLGILAIFPNILQIILQTDMPRGLFSGTGLLIVVGVALELSSQIESYLIEHRYEGFLSSGRMRSRWAR
ncbi:preprotein translocase subunit SecY [Candidatus Dependentiae bacterium]|nr:MAG: preprotein translocase subunit SecY [Candidatus Dependentiae bacterium]